MSKKLPIWSKILVLALVLVLGIETIVSASKRKIEEEEENGSKASKVAKVLSESNVYSDEMPNSKSIFCADLSDKYNWDNNSKDFKLTQSHLFFSEYLLKKGMIKLPGSIRYNNLNLFLVYGKNKDPDSLVAFDIQNHPKSLLPNLEKIKVYTHPMPDISKIWCISGNKSRHKIIMITKEVMEGSWNCINHTIHGMHLRIHGYKDKNSKKPKEDEFFKYFYTIVRKNGLEKSLHRISIVINDDNICSFNVLYNTDEEMRKDTEFITSTFKDLIPKG